MKDQKRKRWCRHLQRVAGSKQFWEVLAFTGRFDAELLRRTLHSGEAEEEREHPAPDPDEKQRRIALHYANAEARARYNEGRRLARQRDMLRLGGASQPAGSGATRCDTVSNTFTESQLEVLLLWDCGMLRHEVNNAIVEFGHGGLSSACGHYLDIEGSIGDGSRRIMDGWPQPDWRGLVE